jgi:hypothetical protein
VSASPSITQDIAIRLEFGVPTGDYRFPVQVHRLFACTPGTHTYYLLGQEGAANDFLARYKKLALLFVASGYGVVAEASLRGADLSRSEADVGPDTAELNRVHAEFVRDREAQVSEDYRLQRETLRRAAEARARVAREGRPKEGENR